MQKKNGFKTKVALTNTVFSAACLAMFMASDASAADIGLAASIGGDDSAIAIPIRTEGYLIQPEISHSFYEDNTESRGYESERISFGIFGYKRVPMVQGLEAQFGVGLGYGHRESDQYYQGQRYNDDFESYFVGPAIGLSYYLNDKVSIGIEARYLYRTSDSVSRSVETTFDETRVTTHKSDDKQASTDTRVTLRYYFAGI